MFKMCFIPIYGRTLRGIMNIIISRLQIHEAYLPTYSRVSVLCLREQEPSNIRVTYTLRVILILILVSYRWPYLSHQVNKLFSQKQPFFVLLCSPFFRRWLLLKGRSSRSTGPQTRQNCSCLAYGRLSLCLYLLCPSQTGRLIFVGHLCICHSGSALLPSLELCWDTSFPPNSSFYSG